MRIYTYSEARQNLSEVLNLSLNKEVLIKRRDGNIFSIKPRKINKKSPFDVTGIKTGATTDDILEAVRVSRNMPMITRNLTINY